MQAYPKFRPDLEAFNHNDGRGHRTVFLKDPVSERFFRVSEYEYRFLKNLNGTSSTEEVGEKLRGEGFSYPTEDRARILSRAAQTGLLLGTQFGTAQYLKAMQDRIGRWKRHQRLASVYFLFIPLVNPDKFLERTLPIFRFL